MKKLFLLTLALLMIVLTSCDLLPADVGVSESAPTDASSQPSETNYDPSVIKELDSQMRLVLPTSKKEIGINGEYRDFAPYITYELVDAAEKDILNKRGTLDHASFNITTNYDGYLRLSVEYIKSVDPEMIENGYEQIPPCGDHWHSSCGGVISSQPLEKYVREAPVDTRASLKDYSDALVEACGDSLEESTGGVDANGIFDGAVKVDHNIVNVESNINLKKENIEAIIVFLRAKESERYESTLVITPKTMFVVTAGFGHPRQFSFLNNRWVITTQSLYMITEAIYERCNAYRDIIDTIKTNNAAAVEPESQFSGDLFYGFMNEESFEVYSHEKLLSILEANGYDTQAFDAFAESCIEIAEIKYENRSDEEDNTEDKDAEEVFDEAVAEK